MKRRRPFKVSLVLLAAAICWGSIGELMAQETAAQQVTSQQTGTQQAVAKTAAPVASEVLNTTGKMKLEVSVMAGGGGKSIDVETTTSGDALKVSGGGGAGIAITAGYGLTPKLEFDLSLGGQTSTEQPAVKNADATFTRSIFRATLKYIVPVNDRIRFKFGGGLGLYSGGKLDVDTTQVAGGSRDIVKYDTAGGVHIVGEFEGLIRNDFTFIAGIRVYGVKYTANSWEHNGVAQPTSGLRNDVRNLDGGGTDLFIGLAKYF